jgi:hypothetical protein
MTKLRLSKQKATRVLKEAKHLVAFTDNAIKHRNSTNFRISEEVVKNGRTNGKRWVTHDFRCAQLPTESNQARVRQKACFINKNKYRWMKDQSEKRSEREREMAKSKKD